MVAAWRTTVSSSDAHAGCMVGLLFGVAEEEREENKRGKTRMMCARLLTWPCCALSAVEDLAAL